MFFRNVKARRVGNAIPMLEDEHGNRLESDGEVINHILNFYMGLFGTEIEVVGHDIPEGARVDDSMFPMLEGMPSKEEVRRVISSIGVNKSPGPDGFGSLFFRECWGSIGNDVWGAVDEFFRRGKLLKQFNATFVALIPKVPNPTMVKDLRPISCCNTMLKTITKLLAERVKMVVGELVSDCQGAFVPGRSMIHNCAIAIDLVKGYGTKRMSPRCTMKVDLHKAYDCVSWEFLGRTLQSFNFPPKLTQLIMECVTTPSYSILINGAPEGYFKGKRGLRQGGRWGR